ncbi:peptidylprolyl isomerase [Paraglaciecola sp.]|uniref:FKBP-type peptidyl-prolyl cis-trans isomerase n=1 Tax=Paraglaciecola sp. TaxID=1920173 RepID=UPI0027400E2E|nr:peptidylprolyl isomerase [Paraglaciecola sp.]MDP5030276.1 peptidylprolyl isomerase [Paraglaciecola sp.]
MQITKDSVVQFNYVIKELDGTEVESNGEQAAVAYLHGHNGMMPGIEKSLEGKQAGDKLSVELPASETFGELLENSEQRVSVKHLQGAKKWSAGMSAVVNTDQGQRQVTIVKVGKFMATVDTNHPLAGKTLQFELEVVNVRAATEEELEHGHAHGDGGHQH